MAMTFPEQTTSDASAPGFKKLLLRSYEGLTYREVSTKPARDCTEDEIPVVDLSGMFSDLEAQKTVAADILCAAEDNGFFYIKNHGIPVDLLNRAHGMAKQYDCKSSEPLTGIGYYLPFLDSFSSLLEKSQSLSPTLPPTVITACESVT